MHTAPRHWFAFRLRTLFVLVGVAAGCERRHPVLQDHFGFPTNGVLFGVILVGVVAAFIGWLYYRATR
jgi:hypothetical protein